MLHVIERRAWKAMIARCINRDHDAYHRYGGRGIKVCKRWLDFEKFLEDVGLRPGRKYSIDRYPDNDGDYRPGNVRWATRKQQQNNMRSNIVLKAFGKEATVAEWAANLKISPRIIYKRIKAGWPPEKTLSQPHRMKSLRKIRIGRRSKTIPQWAKISGIKYLTIFTRLERGWRAKDAIFMPAHERRVINV